MALRILPFRQYSDHDVVNMYSIINSDGNLKIGGYLLKTILFGISFYFANKYINF